MKEEEERRSKERDEERRNKEMEEARRRRQEMEERQYEQDRRSWSYKQAKDRVSANSIHRTTWKKDKPSGPEPIVLRKERYDPFAFQSTPRPKVFSLHVLYHRFFAVFPPTLLTFCPLRLLNGGATLQLLQWLQRLQLTDLTLVSPFRC